MELNAKKVGLILLVVLAVGIFSLGLLAVMAVGNLVLQADTAPGNLAVIDISGPIVDGGEPSPWGAGQAQAGAVMEQINQAREDEEIKALLLRVNSPGGSSAASDAIYRELEKFSETDRPIVVSMGDLAASGGYYVSSLADKIYANQATITGSIGTIMHFQNLEELYDKLGIESETLKSGEYKDSGSPTRSMKDEERELFTEMIEEVHNNFVEVVSEGRDLEKERVEELADGRIYTGSQAQELELIDGLGTYYDAQETAAELGGIEGEPQVVKHDQTGFLERFLSSAQEMVFSWLGRSNPQQRNLEELEGSQEKLLETYLLEQERYRDLKLKY